MFRGSAFNRPAPSCTIVMPPTMSTVEIQPGDRVAFKREAFIGPPPATDGFREGVASFVQRRHASFESR
jgi:hypothetical protein